MILKNSPSKPVIFTDLDGSLLDHETYSHEPADPLLQELSRAGVAVVLCTSKTAAEVMDLREELGNTAPFIVENGAAVYLPADGEFSVPDTARKEGDYFILELCPPRERWIKLLQQAPREFTGAFEGYAHMTPERLMELTGLSRYQATQSMQRGYGEPLHWIGDESLLAPFTRWCESHGARVLKGGRFVHVAGDSSKGRALLLLQSLLQEQTEAPVVSIALGDGHNDVDMIQSADYGVVIRSPVHKPPQVPDQPNLLVTESLGPKGWVEGITYWMNHLQLKNQSDNT